jgi:adenylate kinase family enzyme
MRINVTGNAGAGKTTFASRLSVDLELPHFSLDSIVWQPKWTKTPPTQRAHAERKVVAPQHWIIDGVSPLVREHADLIVFLDVPSFVCSRRVVARSLRYFHRTRPGLPSPCPDILILPHALRLIRRFASAAAPQLRIEASRHPTRFLVASHAVPVETLIRRVRHAIVSSHIDRKGGSRSVLAQT